ncbi:MAG: hypothetical protein EA397_01840 [Deltaproteobacteria bacterium]|nr:MAG: hypothetical protein EA397_01840 [Deltaproteobacteria bacterium]
MDPLLALDRDGYAVLRRFVGTSEVASMSRGFDRLLRQAAALRETGDHHGARFVLDPDPFRLHRVVWCGAAAPELRLGDDPRFVALACRILGRPRVMQLIQQAHFKLPGDGVSFSWHQDASNRRYGTDLWTDGSGEGSFVQMALAIDPTPSGTGPLAVIPGSHRLGFVADPLTGALPPGAFDPSQAVELHLDPGDLVVFGPFLVHGSRANRSTQPRRLFLQGYALPGANRRVYPGCGLGVERRVAPREP